MAAEATPAQPPRGGLRRVVRTILWPLRRFFDPRFAGIHATVQDIRRLVITDMEAANETTTLTGRTLDRLAAQNEEILDRLGGSKENVGTTTDPVAFVYACRALGAVPPGGSVAVVGAQDTWVATALEALGYDVTTDHGLRTAHREGAFDAVLLFAARDIEERVRTLRHLTKPGGLVVLSLDDPHRDLLDELLQEDERTDVTEVDGGITFVTATKRRA